MSSTAVSSIKEAAVPACQKAGTAGCKRVLTQKQPGRKKTKTDATVSATGTKPPRDLLLDYMRQQNRPYNSQLIFENLKRIIKKPELERLLEQLVADGCLVSKDLGKTRVGHQVELSTINNFSVWPTQVFMYSQEQFEASMVCAGDMANELEELREEVKHLQESVKQRTAAKQRLEEARTRAAMLESLRSKVAKAEAELEERRKLQQSGTKSVTAAEASAAEYLHAKLHAAWATQKRRCLELVHILSERTQADDKQLQEELGLERDEDFIPLAAYESYK